MLIELNHIIPSPIPRKLVDLSELWNTQTLIKPNSSILISAKSGMGKSTLLHLLFGLRKDFSGSLTINGKDSAEFTFEDWEMIRRGSISLLFQDLRLFPNLSASENINLIPQVNPSVPSVQEMASRLGVIDFLSQSVSTLSHGQRQRVALIRTLRKPFRLLLLDEPFSHLDSDNQSHACSLVKEIIDNNKAGLILSTLGLVPEISFDQKYSL